MAELTAKKRNYLVLLVVALTCLMLGFHYETIIHGILPDYSFEPNEGTKPQPLPEYVKTYQKMQ